MIGSYVIKVNGFDYSSYIFSDGMGSTIKYRDNMGLVSDTLDITLNDPNLNAADMFPDGAEVECEFTNSVTNKTLKTGKLYVDTEDGSIDSGGDSGGHVVTIGTNSQPESRPSMKTFIAYSKKKVKLKTLLTDILDKAGLGLEYRFNQAFQLPFDVELKNIVIQNEMLAEVLRRYADMFGCYLKCYDDRVIFTNKMALKLDPVLKTINPSESSVRNLRYNVAEHNFKEYEVSYYNPRTGKYTSDKKSKNSTLLTQSETIKRLITQLADSTAARAVAMAVDQQYQCRLNFTTDGDETAIAGGIWEFTNISKFTGKYVITSATHTIGKNWDVEIECENIF